jgi:hypothetical protein
MPASNIISNKVKCRICNWIIESQSDFHLNICGCGKTSVDGGLKELRRYGDMNNIEELSETRLPAISVLTND